MAFEDNKIDIRDLQTVNIRVGDLRDIVTALEYATSILVPEPALVAALDRLRKLIDRKG
jgi:hypothetical protein